MPILRQQFATGNNVAATASPHTLALGQIQAGNLLVVAIATDQNTDFISSVSDGTNAYTKIGTGGTIGLAVIYLNLLYVENCSAVVSPTLTVTLTGACASVIMFMEFSGVATSSALDQFSYLGTATSQHSNSNNLTTPSQDYELLVGAHVSDAGNATYTSYGDFVGQRSTANINIDGSMHYKPVDKALTYNSRMFISAATDNVGGIASFRGAGDGPPSFRAYKTRPRPYAPGHAR